MDFKIQELDIPSTQDHSLGNLFFSTDHSCGWLGIILPGLNYSLDMPLLYYTRMLLLKNGVDVLNLQPATLSDKFKAAHQEEQYAWLRSDIVAGLSAGLAQGDYHGIMLAGKSIGSLGLAVGLPLAQALLPTRAIWITPLLREAIVKQAALADESPALFLCGSGDFTFDQDIMDEILASKPLARAWIGRDGNHSLEVNLDPMLSIELLRGYLSALEDFLQDELR